MTPKTAVRLLAAASVLAILAASCGKPPERGPNQPVGSTSEAHPFRIGQPPAGYRLVQAGRGTRTQAWGDDTFGSEEPVTLLAPVGQGPGGPDEIRVSVFGYQGYQGELSQGSYGYVVNADRLEGFQIDGEPAIYSPDFSDGNIRRPADLVVDKGDGVGLRVTKSGGSRDELTAVARGAEPLDDSIRAPGVARPPEGLEVVGSADADVAYSLEESPVPYSGQLPAGTRAWCAVWALPITPEGAWRAEYGSVVVTTLPGESLDLDAAVAVVRRPFERTPAPRIERIEVAGRPGIVLRFPDTEAQGARRAVATSTAGGDLLTVAGYGASQPAEDELIAVAASVEEATPAEWEQMVVEAGGGPGLVADTGAVELQRGKVGDTEWLLQAVDAGASSRLKARPGPQPSGMTVDDCLKTPAGRLCTNRNATQGNPVIWFFNFDARIAQIRQQPGPTNFMIVTVMSPAARARVHLDGRPPLLIQLHPVPGSDPLRAGIVMDLTFPVAEGRNPLLGAPGLACRNAGEPLGPGTFELLDGGGRRVTCPI